LKPEKKLATEQCQSHCGWAQWQIGSVLRCARPQKRRECPKEPPGIVFIILTPARISLGLNRRDAGATMAAKPPATSRKRFACTLVNDSVKLRPCCPIKNSKGWRNRRRALGWVQENLSLPRFADFAVGGENHKRSCQRTITCFAPMKKVISFSAAKPLLSLATQISNPKHHEHHAPPF
jgi:hypothetical protein